MPAVLQEGLQEGQGSGFFTLTLSLSFNGYIFGITGIFFTLSGHVLFCNGNYYLAAGVFFYMMNYYVAAGIFLYF